MKRSIASKFFLGWGWAAQWVMLLLCCQWPVFAADRFMQETLLDRNIEGLISKLDE